MFKAIHSFFRHHYHSRYIGTYRHAKQLFIFDLALLAVAIIMFGASLYFFFWKPKDATFVDMRISIGSSRVVSGDAVTIGIDYTNHSQDQLTEPVLAVQLPKGFIIDRSKTPESLLSEQHTVTLPTIEPGGTGHFELYGRLWGIPNIEERIGATLAFKRAHVRERERGATSFFLTLPGSTLIGNLEIASTSLANQPTSFIYRLKNTGKDAVEDISLIYDHNRLQFSTSTATFSLNAGEERSFFGRTREFTKNGDYTISIASEVTRNNHPLRQTLNENGLAIIAPEIVFSAAFENAPKFAEVNQTVPVTFSWKNQGSQTLENMRIRLTTTRGVVDLDRTARENNLDRDGDTLIITKRTRAALAEAKPGNEDTFTINLELASHFAIDDVTTWAELIIKPTLESNVAFVPQQTFTQSAKEIKLPLSTEVTMKTTIRYYTEDGDQLGRGPLPPVVGDITRYWVFIEALNTTNPLKNNSLAVVLGPQVRFTGKQSVTVGPQLRYDAESQTITWNHRLTPAQTNLGFFFEIAVTPSPDMLGKPVTLIKSINLKTTDDITNKLFNFNTGPLTNVLAPDDKGAAKGAAVVSE